jgi:hypothetical protein
MILHFQNQTISIKDSNIERIIYLLIYHYYKIIFDTLLYIDLITI